MIRALKITILSITAMICISPPAFAGSKIWRFWWPSHWENLDFKPYPENSRQSQNTQWNHSTWTPAQWFSARPELIADLYTADIIRDQDIDDDIPVLEVGQGFYLLGGEDKRRVARALDEAYQITTSHPNGIFILRDEKTGDDIGVYSSAGLQLQ